MINNDDLKTPNRMTNNTEDAIKIAIVEANERKRLSLDKAIQAGKNINIEFKAKSLDLDDDLKNIAEERIKVMAEILANNNEEVVTDEGKLTDLGVETLEKTLSEVQSEDSKFIESLPSNNGVDEIVRKDGEEIPELESEDAIGIMDPNTGKIMHTSPNDIDYIGDLDEVMKMVDEDLTTFSVTEENIKNALKEQFGKEFPHESLVIMADLANRYNRKEKYSYYNSLPNDVKKCVNDILSSYGMVNNKQARNEFVKSTLQTIIYSSYIDQSVIDIDHTMEQTMQDIKTDIEASYGLFSAQQRYNLEEKTLEIAKSKEETDPEKAQLLRDISASFIQSYTYENMMKDYKANPGKFKVKKIELEKFGNRLAMGFNNKYKNSKFTIRNVESLIPILKRWLPGEEEEKIKKFIAIFIKYTVNMKPENLPEHVFMYYFVKNIESLECYNHSNEEEEKFYGDLLQRINSIYKEIA